MLIVAALLWGLVLADSPFARPESLQDREGEWGPSEAQVHDVASWVQSHSIAQFLNLTYTARLHVPVQVNVVMIGFQADGDGQLYVSPQRLQKWFEHLAHRVQHRVLPIGEESNFQNDEETTWAGRETGLEFDFQARFIMADPLVTVALENVLLQNARKDDDDRTYYVDVYRVTSLLHHFLDSLNLTNSSYTLFLLNPKGPVEFMRYGYRAGLAKWEIDALRQDTEWQRKMDVLVSNRLASKQRIPTLAPRQTNLGADGVGRAWAKWYLKHASEMADDCRANADPDDEASSMACLAHWTVSKLSLHGLTRHMAQRGSRYHLRYLQALVRDEVLSDCLVDSWVSHERFAFIDVSAGPFEWSPAGSSSAGTRKRITVPRHNFEAAKDAVIKDDNPLTEFEKLKYEYQIGCLSDRKPDERCAQFLARLHEYEHKVQRQDVPMNENALESWLADLSALSARAIRHLFVPGVPMFEVPFSPRVHIVLYIVRTHSDYDPRGPEYFHWNEYMDAIKRLAAPSQTFTFSVHQLTTGSEQAMAHAFHQSLHNAVLPSIEPDTGSFKPKRHVYVDSKLLRSKLYDSVKVPRDILVTERQVPVFFFSTNYAYPVFVDKYFQARALSDMVIVTQSNFRAWTSRMRCNGHPVVWDLRDPLRETLAATAMHMSGLLPPHVAYSSADHCVNLDWLWSVGDHPMSQTSHGLHFGEIQSDMAARNYLLNGLEQAMNRSNVLLRKLFEAPTTPENFDVIQVLSREAAGRTLTQLWAAWDEILESMGHLRWHEALQLLPEQAHLIAELEQAVGTIMQHVAKYKCSNAATESRYSWSGVLIGALLLDAVAVVSYVVWLRVRKRKVKIN